MTQQLIEFLASLRRVWAARLRRVLWRNESRFDALLDVLERLAEYKRQELEEARKAK